MGVYARHLGHRASVSGSRRVRLAASTTIAMLLLMGLFSAVAKAGQLSVPSITDTPPSAAAGAKSIYTVGFTTSSTGGLSAAAGSQITITFPANTDLTGLVGSSVRVPAVSANSIGNCFR